MSEKYHQNKQRKILKRNHSSNTILSTKKSIERQSKYQPKHHVSKSFQISFDENQKTRNLSKTSKIYSSIIYNNNNESSLLKNLQLIDSDNAILKEVV